MDNYFENPNIIDISSVPYAIGFSFYSSREIHDLSNVEIICPVFFDLKGSSVLGGLCDSRMGINSKETSCNSCGGNYVSCPGHFGHINFIIPLQNPYLKNIFSKIIKAKCWYCNFFKTSNLETRIAYFKFLGLDSKNFFDFKKKPNFDLKKKPPAQIIENKKNFFLYLRFIKNLTREIKKSWDFEHFPRISFIEKNKRGKFWCMCLLFFLKLCTVKEFCQKCQKKKVRTLSVFGDFRLIQQKAFILKKKLTFQRKFYTHHQIFSFCLETLSEIYNYVNNNYNSKTFQLKKQIDDLWRYEKDFCEIVWGSFGASFRFEKRLNSEIFFLSCILVSPNRFRPIHFSKIKEKNTEIETNPQNFYFTKALLLNQQFLLAISSFSSDLDINLSFQSFGELEKLISNLFDNYSDSPEKKKKSPLGIKQRLEKKFGLFRMYMMGKRVFHSARSIIIPDPFLNSFEVGIPSLFAQKLSFPLTVNCFSYFQLSKFMKESSGSKNKIDCQENIVETYFGKKSLFSSKNKESFLLKFITIIKKYKKYFLQKKIKNYGINRCKRSLVENDLVLLNRQPSLHRASLMSHPVRLTEHTKCIRIHYSNCNSYNADFDGDEMNIHFPQNILAIAESLMLSIAFNHAKIPTHNMIMRGLIQDNIITSVNLTNKDTFLSEANLFHLLNSTINGKEKLKFSFYPAIIKPKILWTGKQLFSLVLKLFLKKRWFLNLESRTKLTKIFFGKDETKILIRNGELLRGVIDASQIGRNRHGLFHAFDEMYGNFITDKLLSVLCKSLVFFQRINGFTSGLEDLILRKQIDKNRIKFFRKEKEISYVTLKKTLSNNGIFSKKILHNNFFDTKFLKIISFLFTYRKLFEFFSIKSKNIFNRISSNVIENTILGGMDKKFFINGFLQMTITGAKGSALNVFQICSNLGQIELEEQFIPLGYGGKTLPIFPPFDFSYLANAYVFQRFLTGIGQSEFFFHCIAGREGLLDTSVKTSQSGYIQRSLIKHFESLKLNQDLTVRFGDGSVAQFYYFHNGLNSCAFDFDCFLSWFFQNFKTKFLNGMYVFPKLVHQLDNKCDFKKKKTKKKSIRNFFYKNNVFSIGEKNIKKVTSMVNRSNFLRKNRFSIWNFFFEEKDLINLYRKNLAPPGEPLGIITSHSLGEPCTQMTLNTFHFAGKLVSKHNSGIPRLKELILVASQQPNYPTMSGFFKKNLSLNVYFSFEKRLKRIFFYDLIESIHSFSFFSENIPIFTFRFRIVSKRFFKHILGLRKSDVINQIKFFWKKLKIKYVQKNRFDMNAPGFPSYYSLKKLPFFKNNDHRNKKNFFKFKNQNSKNDFQFFTDMNFLKLQKKNLTIFGKKTLGFEKCIREIKRVKNGFIDYKEKSVHIEGINFYFFWKNSDLINCKKIFTNNIFSMTTIYGIEAGRETLFYELATIFKMQTISVNNQHIDLVSDYMMRLGFYRSLSRKGIAEENIFQKITYETAIEFLINSSINQTSEILSSTSSLISLAKICTLGTGNFDILFKKIS